MVVTLNGPLCFLEQALVKIISTISTNFRERLLPAAADTRRRLRWRLLYVQAHVFMSEGLSAGHFSMFLFWCRID